MRPSTHETTLNNDAQGTLTQDLVELLNPDGTVCGTHPRNTVHTTNTPLHRAFSSYLFDDNDRLLLTRRSLSKVAWPGVWTNACCGHPRPGETSEQAAQRRIPEELGAHPSDLRVALPEYRYRAVDASGVVEHEVCPVLVGRIRAADVAPNPNEVCETSWVRWADAVAIARHTPALLSPWAAEQILLLDTTDTLKPITSSKDLT